MPSADNAATTPGLLPQECPNCGRLHPGFDFDKDPGPVQRQLAEARAEIQRLNKVIAYGVTR